MRVDDLGPVLSNLVRALANRLTAEDNWGPEGTKWFVLTSRGPRDVDPPPTFMDIRKVILEALATPPTDGNGDIPLGITGPPGPPGPEGPPGSNGMVPTKLLPGETFTVPENKQALYAYPIDASEGTLNVEGTLIEVDGAGAGTAVILRGASWANGGNPVNLDGMIKVITPKMQVAGTITGGYIIGQGVGSASWGVKKCAEGVYPGGLADITGGTDPAIVVASIIDISLTGWSTAVLEGDIFEFELKSASDFTQVEIVLEITPG